MAKSSPAGMIVDAAQLLAGKGLLGIVRVDSDLVAVERYGSLADWVPLGKMIHASVVPLIGFEEEIRALRRQTGCQADGQLLQMAGVAVRNGVSKMPRLDLSLSWHEKSGSYILLLCRADIAGDRLTEMRQLARVRQLMETELLAKTDEISRANSELTRANRDLDAFASIISHDLKAPLRALRFLARQLADELGEAAPDSMLDKVAAIHEQSSRMNAMLSDLLAYSRIGRKAEAMSQVDTGKLVRRVVDAFGLPETMRVDITGEWPKIATLEAPLDLVLRNLIDNAIKHHDRQNLHIEVSCRENGAVYLIAVADDGPGIEPAYHEIIFEPFQKVAEENKPDSSGMGLALIKRTLDQFGGEISLASDPARRRGTTFRVTWPKVPRL